MTAPAPDRARDPWQALARHLTSRDPWRTPAFVQPPALPLEDPDDVQEDTAP